MTGARLPIQREESMSQRSIRSTTLSPRSSDAPGASRPILRHPLVRAALILAALTAAVPPRGRPTWSAQAAATPSSACTATLSRPAQLLPISSAPTINVTGTGYLAGEAVQVYFDAALPFGGPAQGSSP